LLKERRYKLMAVSFAILSVIAMLMLRTQTELVLTHDSLAYLYSAETLLSGEGFVYFGYTSPLIQWPFGMPVLLMLYGFLGDPMTIAQVMNFVFLFAAVLFSCLTADELIDNAIIKIACMATMSFSAFVFKIYHYLWSECAFFAFTAIFVYLAVKYFKYDGKLISIIPIGIFATLSMFTRFVGMELCGLFGICLLVQPNKSIKRRLGGGLIYLLVGGVPYIAMLVRNYLVSGSFTGRSTPSVTPFADNVKNTILALAQYVCPNAQGYAALGVVFVLLALMVAGLVFAIKYKKISIVHIWLLIHICAYPAMVIYSNTCFALDPVSYRVITPMYFILATMLFWLISKMVEKAKATKVLWMGITAIFAILVIGFNLNYADNMTVSPYFVEENFQNDELVRFAKVQDAETTVFYTNKPGEIFLNTHVRTNYTPRREGLRIYSFDAFVSKLDLTKSNYIIWYNGYTNPQLYTPSELGEHYELLEVQRFDNGVVYKIMGER